MQPVTGASEKAVVVRAETLSQAIETGNYLVMKRQMEQKAPLTMDEFCTICFKCPPMALFAIQSYPDLAKEAPFELLLTLCRKSTFQEVIYEAVWEHVDPRPTTEDILIALIEAGACITGREKITGYTLLHHALENDLERAALSLLDHGIDPLAKIHWGVTPLHMASRNGYRFYNVIQKILKISEQAITQVTKCGSTPLHFAARAKSISAVDLLIDAGADRLAVDEMHQTALDVAKQVPDNFHVVTRLKKSDAAYALSNWKIDKAIALLKDGEILSEDDFLSVCVCKPEHALRIACECPQSVKFFSDTFFIKFINGPACHTMKLAAKLVDAGISTRGVDEQRRTLLHLAIQRHNSTLTRKLLAAGLDHSAQDDVQETPLHYSVMAPCADVLEDLVKAGASLDAVNDRNETPHQLAVRIKSRSWLEAYSQLKNK